MKNIIVGTFVTQSDAENAIQQLHNDVGISKDDISYIYKSLSGVVHELDTNKVNTDTPVDSAISGAGTGTLLGTIAGVVAVVAAIPAVGPIFVAGPLIAALGIGGAAGTIAAGAATGALAGGIVGSLMNWGITEDKAKLYEQRVTAGDVLLVVHSDKGGDVSKALVDNNGYNVEVYSDRVYA